MKYAWNRPRQPVRSGKVLVRHQSCPAVGTLRDSPQRVVRRHEDPGRPGTACQRVQYIIRARPVDCLQATPGTTV